MKNSIYVHVQALLWQFSEKNVEKGMHAGEERLIFTKYGPNSYYTLKMADTDQWQI